MEKQPNNLIRTIDMGVDPEEADIEGQDEEDDTIEVSKKEMLNEHIKLIRILETGNKKDLIEEAKRQREEIGEYR